MLVGEWREGMLVGELVEEGVLLGEWGRGEEGMLVGMWVEEGVLLGGVEMGRGGFQFVLRYSFSVDF